MQEDAMPLGLKQMMDVANAAVPRITPGEAREMIGKGNTLVLDVRDGTEVAANGKIAGALHVSRGLLEFRADPDSPAHDKNFSNDKTILVYCGSGGRAALSGKLLKDMGYDHVYNIGGFKEWVDSGGDVEK
jgi:rhodanese-related sulfurtransferase